MTVVGDKQHAFSPLVTMYHIPHTIYHIPQDWETPDFVKEEAVKAITEHNHNQYTRAAGNPELVKAVAARYSKTIGRTIEPMSEVAVASGANGMGRLDCGAQDLNCDLVLSLFIG